MLAELGGRLFRQAFARDNTPEDMRAYLDQHFTEAALARVLATPGHQVLLLEEQAVPVGWALLVTGTSAPRRTGGASRTPSTPGGHGARGPLSLERLSALPDGRFAYRMKRPSPSGQTHLVLPPVAFLRRGVKVVGDLPRPEGPPLSVSLHDRRAPLGPAATALRAIVVEELSRKLLHPSPARSPRRASRSRRRSSS
jgi:hypothetical protein